MAKGQGRTGTYVRQPAGYRAFIPERLPFPDPLVYDDRLILMLSNADRAIGELNAAAEMLPNPNLFVGMYITKESVLSSQIEGVTQASLSEVMEQEARRGRNAVPADIAEVLNHVDAMNYGLDRLQSLPLSNRLIREIHARLMAGVRGGEKTPGEFRTTQNWIGAPDCDLSTAVFVPPPPHAMNEALGDLERFFHEDSALPPLMKAGLIHYQFETIHPFLDGNGRVGRLLVVLYLCHQRVLRRPLLYLSEYINTYRNEYYRQLQSVRDQGTLEEWMLFFLSAVWRVAEAAGATARKIMLMREQHRAMVQSEGHASNLGLQLLDHLFSSPLINVNKAKDILGVSYPTASNSINLLARLGILEEYTGQERNRMFRYSPYLGLMEEGLSISTPIAGPAMEAGKTSS